MAAALDRILMIHHLTLDPKHTHTAFFERTLGLVPAAEQEQGQEGLVVLRGELPRALERVAAYVATPEVCVCVYVSCIIKAMAIAMEIARISIILIPSSPSSCPGGQVGAGGEHAGAAPARRAGVQGGRGPLHAGARALAQQLGHLPGKGKRQGVLEGWMDGCMVMSTPQGS